MAIWLEKTKYPFKEIEKKDKISFIKNLLIQFIIKIFKKSDKMNCRSF